MKAYERLIKYAKVYTMSDEESSSVPTTARQFDLARMLADEMRGLGISDAVCDDKCYVYGHIPATPGYEDAPRLGFIAHVDTAPDFSGEGIRPVVIENYDGGDVTLGESGRVLRVSDFPHLPKLKGRTLITTDGTTLLGADDKAGIAEILTLAELLLAGDIPHGPISIGFTPDEEVGAGADNFDIAAFGADFAYTVDGGEENQLEYENFNAAAAKLEITGFNVHPGTSKNTMINALLVGIEANNMLPSGETPRGTEKREGFYHLCDMSGCEAQATMKYIIRDHDAAMFDARIATLEHIVKLLNEKYGEGTVKLTVREQYRNMIEKIRENYHLVKNALAAIREAGLTPDESPIRGGTDGARLSFMGLPCPNLGTGGYAFHGPYEHITAEGMDTVVQIMLGLVRRYSTKDALK